MATSDADRDWKASAADKGGHVAVVYQAPCCGTWCELNVQTPGAGDPVETELWCHRDGQGTKATITLD